MIIQVIKKGFDENQILYETGAPEKIRTPNLLIRSQMLYPIELRAHQRR